ncbi:SDR family NAD(P)-dependent oxidoreductase, partial [Rhizobium sp. SIMBA_035]
MLRGAGRPSRRNDIERGCAMGRSINLEGKVALVTGASSGLGQRFAQVLSQAGAKVVLASRRVERLKELRAEIEA